MSKADWRRTPPATSRMTFWASPSGSRNPDSLISAGNSIRSVIDAKDVSKNQAPTKRMEGEVYTGVSVKDGTMTGIMGTFTIASSAIRWSGRKVESTSRPILGEVVDALNRDPENWTISFSKESIKKLSSSEDQTNLIIIVLDDGGSCEFSFRNPSECRAALLRLKVELGHLEKGQESSSASRQKRKQREQSRRRSISFHDVLEDEEEQDENDQDTENINPAQRLVSFPLKKMSNIQSLMHSSKELGSTTASVAIGSSKENLEELRSLVRAYCSGNSSASQVSAAAKQIKTRFNYDIGEHSLGTEFNVNDTKWLSESEKKAKQMEMMNKLRPMLEEMKNIAFRERRMIEEETQVSIRSPCKGKKGYEFSCKQTGTDVPAEIFTRRYFERILKYPIQTCAQEEVQEESTSSRVIVETNSFDVSTLMMNNENINNEQSIGGGENNKPLQTKQQQNCANREIKSITSASVGMTPNPTMNMKSVVIDMQSNQTSTSKGEFDRELALEEEKLHQAFDHALEIFKQRRKELEIKYFGHEL